MSKVALVVEFTIASGQLDRFLDRVGRHADTCLAKEKGCLRFDILVPHDASDRVYLYELYADQAAVDTHLASEHMAEYLADTKDMIAERKRVPCTLFND